MNFTCGKINKAIKRVQGNLNLSRQYVNSNLLHGKKNEYFNMYIMLRVTHDSPGRPVYIRLPIYPGTIIHSTLHIRAIAYVCECV